MFYLRYIQLLVLIGMGAMSFDLKAAAVLETTQISYVFGGYSDGSIAIVPINPVQNPASCADSSSYIIPGGNAASTALPIIIEAKLLARMLTFSVRDDVCHQVDQTDLRTTVPVIQRIGLE